MLSKQDLHVEQWTDFLSNLIKEQCFHMECKYIHGEEIKSCMTLSILITSSAFVQCSVYNNNVAVNVPWSKVVCFNRRGPRISH